MAINLDLYIKEVLGDKELSEISDAFLEAMDDIKDLQTQNGRSPAKGGRWNNSYSPEYAKRQGRRSPVTLRSNRGSQSIERTTIVDKGAGAKRLKFTDREKGKIFKLHQDGTAKGQKIRQVYPENESQIPAEANKAAQIKLNEIISRNG